MKPEIRWERDGDEAYRYCMVYPCELCGALGRHIHRPKCHFFPCRRMQAKGWPVVYYGQLCKKCGTKVRAICNQLRELREIDLIAKTLDCPSELRGVTGRIRVSSGLYID